VRVDLEHVLGQPVARVFAVMADVRNRPLWQENTRDVVPLSDGEPGVGTRWRETVKGIGTYEAEVVAFERDRLWVEAADLDAGSGRIEVNFAPEAEGATRLRIAVEIRLRGTKKLMAPALGPMIRRQMPSDLGRLEALLARGEGATPA
jgi:uncharacterized protein YndB with AHSA1/START domain